MVHAVTISNSSGIGLLFYHIQEESIVSSSNIIDGHSDLRQLDVPTIGGAIVMVSDELLSYATFNIFNSTISGNRFPESSSNNDYSCYRPMNSGAITLALLSLTDVFIDSSEIVDNTRGISVYMNFKSRSNIYTMITNTDISRNNMSSSFIYKQEHKFDIYLTNITSSNKLIIDSFGNSNNLKTLFYHFDDKTIIAVGDSNITIQNSNKNKYGQYPISVGQIKLCPDFDKLTLGLYKCSLTNCTVICPVMNPTCSALSLQGDEMYCPCGSNGVFICGQCVEGYSNNTSVVINSPYMPCVPCNDTVHKEWGKLLALEFIPITVMVAVIAVLNVNLNQGSLKAYIFFSQIVSLPMDYILFGSHNEYYSFRQFVLIPYSIWNLDFIDYFSCNSTNGNCNDSSMCISLCASPLEAIVFWYAIGFFPFLLLALSYACMFLYNNDYKYIVCIFRPVHRLLARFWRIFNIQPSLPHTIASVYTLCFTRLLVTSVQLLIPFYIHSGSALRICQYIPAFYNGLLKSIFSNIFAGTILLTVFIIVPTVYLSLYPFKCCQRCLNTLKNRKWLVALKQLLVSVTDVYTAPYKDGTNNTADYRYFASTHFFVLITAVAFYSLPVDTKMFIYISASCCIALCIPLIVFRPYKRNIHTITETFILLFYSLVLLFALLELSNVKVPDEFQLYILFPSIIAFIYCFVWFIKKTKCVSLFKHKQRAPVNMQEDFGIQYQEEYDNGEYYPDRITNPTKYRESHVGYKELVEPSTINEMKRSLILNDKGDENN